MEDEGGSADGCKRSALVKDKELKDCVFDDFVPAKNKEGDLWDSWSCVFVFLETDVRIGEEVWTVDTEDVIASDDGGLADPTIEELDIEG